MLQLSRSFLAVRRDSRRSTSGVLRGSANIAQEMAFVGPYAVAGKRANRQSPGYASSDQRSLSTNVLLLVQPALPKKAYVRLGSLADMHTSPRHVRFNPDSGRWGLRIQNGH